MTFGITNLIEYVKVYRNVDEIRTKRQKKKLCMQKKLYKNFELVENIENLDNLVRK